MTARAEVCGVCGVGHLGSCAFLGRHLDHLRSLGHTAGTVYSRKRAILRAAAALDVPLAEASSRDLLGWLMRLDVASDTRRDYTTHLRRFMAFAVEDGLRHDDPAASLPVPRKSRRLPRPCGTDALMLALQTAPPRIRPWLICASYMGLRAREIAFLRRENILETADPPVLLVTRHAAKGGRFERIVPLPPHVVADIPSWGLPRSGWAFPRHDGKPGPNTPAKVSQLANLHLHDVGVDSSLHTLRHWYGTLVYRQRRDLLAVQGLMGHRDPASTAGYAAYDQAGAAADVAALPVPPNLRMVKP
jgi:integrase